MAFITGTPGPEVLTGTSDDDHIFGKGGADTLTGGLGADVFVIGPGESPTSAAAGGHIENLVRITDFSPGQDSLVFTGEPASVNGTQGNFIGLTNPVDLPTAFSQADALFKALPTKVYIAAEVGQDLIIIDNQHQAVVLANTSFLTFGSVVIGDGLPVSTTPPPVVPAHGVTAVIGGNPDISQLSNLLDNGVPSFSSTSLSLRAGASSFSLTGFGFTIDSDENLTGGTVTGIDLNLAGGPHLHIAGLSTSALTFADELSNDTSAQIIGLIFNGDDSITDDAASSTIHGYAGRDTIQGLAGNASLFGDDGDDKLTGGAGADLLVGGAGADTLTGGGGADVFEFFGGDSSMFAGAGGHLERLDHITDWTSSDFLQFSGEDVASPTIYRETTAPTFDQALDIARTNDSHLGVTMTAVQVGSDVVVFTFADGAAVVLDGRTLADISQVNLGGDPARAQPDPSQTSLPPPVAGVQMGTGANDVINATSSVSEVHSGAGNDTIVGANVHDYLRGDDGDDSISGGAAFDDANGNMGNDTIHGNAGDDYSVGGKDNDLLFGDAGNDIVWGNLGNDTCDGGDGNDQCRGGQGDDSVSGGAGNDFVSGDRGNDTISGGAGADLFHGSQDAGIDRVLDFNQAEGDRVMLDPGTTYTLSQVGADTVIDMGPTGGQPNQMILVGVQLSSLTSGWIFEG